MLSRCSQKAYTFDQIMRSCQPLTRISLWHHLQICADYRTDYKGQKKWWLHRSLSLAAEKSKKGYEVWITDLGLNKATAIISHVLKAHHRNNDILVISGFIFMMSLGKLWELVMDREASHAVDHGVAKSWIRLSDWAELSYYH